MSAKSSFVPRWSIGAIAIAAALAIGFMFAVGERAPPSKLEGPAPPAQDASVQSVEVAPDITRTPYFPAFAPDGVIVVEAPRLDERGVAPSQARIQAPEQAYERATGSPRAQVAIRTPAYESVRTIVSPPASPAPRYDFAASPQRGPEETTGSPRAQTTAGEAAVTDARAVVVEDQQARDDEVSPPTEEDRSWYRSPGYWRELEEQRRAERQARSRNNRR